MESLDQVAAEIDKLRDELHQLYFDKNRVTTEILLLSCELDEKINQYLRIKDEMKSGKNRIKPVKN